MAAMVLQIGYVGSKGTHIYSLPDVNMPPPGSFANEQVNRPYYSQYPQFGQINTINSTNNSSYNSLQVQLKTKNYHGLTTEFAYTWAHAIDDASETMDFFGTSGFVPKDSLNPGLNRANSEFDVPQAISASYVYQFPSFTHSKGMGYLVNQWQLSGVVSWHDSMYLPVLTYDDISGTGELHDVPNCVGPLVTQLNTLRRERLCRTKSWNFRELRAQQSSGTVAYSVGFLGRKVVSDQRAGEAAIPGRRLQLPQSHQFWQSCVEFRSGVRFGNSRRCEQRLALRGGRPAPVSAQYEIGFLKHYTIPPEQE